MAGINHQNFSMAGLWHYFTNKPWYPVGSPKQKGRKILQLFPILRDFTIRGLEGKSPKPQSQFPDVRAKTHGKWMWWANTHLFFTFFHILPSWLAHVWCKKYLELLRKPTARVALWFFGPIRPIPLGRLLRRITSSITIWLTPKNRYW